MKNKELPDNVDTLPHTDVVCDIIMRLDAPTQAMAWLMVETALRLSDIQALRVSNFMRERRELRVCIEGMTTCIELSPGLAETLEEYLYSLRLNFEKTKRWNSVLVKGRQKEILIFSEMLMFPLWILPGNERADLSAPVTTSLFVRALQVAARESNYEGRIQSHTLRHVCTARWLGQGISVAEIHRKLGHHDLMTTLMLVQALTFGGLTYTPDVSMDSAMKIAC